MSITARVRRTRTPRASGVDRPVAPAAPVASDAAAPSDAALIERALAGDGSAFAGLYARHHVALFRTALGMTRHHARAEELVQEAFLRAHRHMGRVVLPPGGSLRPWLQRILVHLVYDDAARRRPVTVPLDGLHERLAGPRSAPTEGRVEARALRRTVADAIAQLPEKHRLVVLLFYLQDLDVEAIAAMLNVPTGTVKSRLFYGRARLRELLAAEDPTADGRVGAWEPSGAVG